jgi:hypothetical protein
MRLSRPLDEGPKNAVLRSVLAGESQTIHYAILRRQKYDVQTMRPQLECGIVSAGRMRRAHVATIPTKKCNKVQLRKMT